MYLIDTNIWLELLLEQEKAQDVYHLLEKVDPAILHITEFTFYSLGIILLRLSKSELFMLFVKDTLLDGGIRLIKLSPVDMEILMRTAQCFNLDFDDAYQYVAADKFNLEIVSFDSDFDRTERGRKLPAQIEF